MNNIIGVWMWPKSILLHGAESVVSWCARAKVTDIYFLAKGLGGTAAFRGSFAPCDEDRDLLQELLEAAHVQGIRVHAWFTSASDDHYKALHPESGRWHFRNGPDKGLISLADKGYLAYMTDIIRELVQAYPVDGLHLDYIRYNHLLYGWSDRDVSRYAAEGADPDHLRQLMEKMFYADVRDENALFDAYRSGDASVLALARARRKDVVHFARTLADAARAVRPDLILSAALMPEGAYDDLAFSDLHYGQNYEDAAKIYDYALPMAYSKAYEKDSSWVRSVADGTMKRGMKTIVGLHAYEGGTAFSLKEDIGSLLDSGAEGYCLFREGAAAMAFLSNQQICIYNALDDVISKVTYTSGGNETILNADICPGQSGCFEAPDQVELVRVFCGDKECCVYMTYED